MKHKTLYKRASTKAIHVWWMESDIDRYRTHHGVEGGEVVSSDWTYPVGKNIGKTNETTAKEQTALEITSAYEAKVTKGKYTDVRGLVDAAKESYFSPMLAEKFDESKIHGSFYIQPKFNGARCIADRNGLWSRTGKEFVNVPHINEALKEFFELYPNRILDGELYNHKYKSDFNSLISSIKKLKPTKETQEKAAKVVEYYIYDTYEDSAMFRNETFGGRIEFINDVFGSNIFKYDAPIIQAKTFRSSDLLTAKGLHQKITDEGYEGTIIRLDTPYENKRTHSLMKYKDFIDEEFEIADITEGKGNWAGVAKVVWIILPGRPIRPGDYFLDKDTDVIKKAVQADIATLGIHSYRVSKATVKGNKAYCKKLLENKDICIGKLGTVRYFDLTPDNVPLFPVFECVRDYE